MIRWFQMPKSFLLCKRFWRLWTSRTSLLRSTIGKYSKPWSRLQELNTINSRQFAAQLTNWIRNHGKRSRRNWLVRRESLRQLLTNLVNLLPTRVTQIKFFYSWKIRRCWVKKLKKHYRRWNCSFPSSQLSVDLARSVSICLLLEDSTTTLASFTKLCWWIRNMKSVPYLEEVDTTNSSVCFQDSKYHRLEAVSA